MRATYLLDSADARKVQVSEGVERQTTGVRTSVGRRNYGVSATQAKPVRAISRKSRHAISKNGGEAAVKALPHARTAAKRGGQWRTKCAISAARMAIRWRPRTLFTESSIALLFLLGHVSLTPRLTPRANPLTPGMTPDTCRSCRSFHIGESKNPRKPGFLSLVSFCVAHVAIMCQSEL